MTQIVAVISHKGGTGKTSLVQNLAHELGRTRRVLAVDLDPQSNLTIGSGLELLDERPTVLQAMHTPALTGDALIQTGNYWLLPASLDLYPLWVRSSNISPSYCVTFWRRRV